MSRNAPLEKLPIQPAPSRAATSGSWSGIPGDVADDGGSGLSTAARRPSLSVASTTPGFVVDRQQPGARQHVDLAQLGGDAHADLAGDDGGVGQRQHVAAGGAGEQGGAQHLGLGDRAAVGAEGVDIRTGAAAAVEKHAAGV